MPMNIDAFYDVGSFPYDSKSIGTRDIKKYFSETLPNLINNNVQTIDLEKITQSANVRSGKSESVLKNLWLRGNRKDNTDYTVAAKNAECEAIGNGDSFDHLVSLASSVDKQNRLRCGWVYNNQNAEQGRGAYGNSEGPFNTTASGTWMWNLDAAQQKFHTDICQNVKGCQDIGASMYKNRCGWCKTSGKAIPIRGSSVAYPFNPNTACSPDNLIVGGGNCPASITPGFAGGPVGDSASSSIGSGSLGYGGLDQIDPPSPAEACTPLPNGALPRYCLLEKLKVAGCSDEGSMYRAIRGGADKDYTNVLRDQQAWSVYQQRAKIPMDDNGLKTGQVTIVDTLNDFKKLENLAASGANTGLKFAARDLCYKKGAIDQFDFCAEIQDTASGPFTLDCLQKAFLRGGGQKAGAAFPNSSSMAAWNSIKTWGAVKTAVQNIFSNTLSNNRKVQSKAMMDFYGIKMQVKKVIYGDPLRYVEGGDVQAYNNNSQIVVLNDGYFPPSPEGIGYNITGIDVPEGTKVVGYRFGKSNPSSRYDVIFMDLSNPIDGVNTQNPVYYSSY